MSQEDASAAFRQNSTRGFRVFVVTLVTLGVGILALGWWLGSWWGLAAGAAIAAVMVGGGLIAGTMLWAMTQDSA